MNVLVHPPSHISMKISSCERSSKIMPNKKNSSEIGQVNEKWQTL